MHDNRRTLGLAGALLALGLSGVAMPAFAVPPEVKTVPWVAANPLIPHDTFAGKTIRLKGTVDPKGEPLGNLQYSWDFGDGTSTAFAAVTDPYALEASKAYPNTIPVGTVITARLTVRNTVTGETDTKPYFIKMEPQTQAVEVNVAIDEGLWYLHKFMYRNFTCNGLPCGRWYISERSSDASGYYPVSNAAANLTAFFVNGHLETSSSNNPYTETVQRGMRYLMGTLARQNLSDQTYPAPIGTVNPDSNGNGYGLTVSGGDQGYEMGQVLDAIVASGTPARVAETGIAEVLGRTYKDIAQDIVDVIAWGQGNSGTYYGGWRYTWNYGGDSDNSANQWNAIGLLGAERQFGIPIPSFVKQANINSVNLTQAANGVFGYTNSTSPIWGPYAVTPSGMVQMVMDQIGRPDARWVKSETYMRDNFCNNPASGATVSPRAYYYGLFSLTKSMLLHDASGVKQPLACLQSTTASVQPIDWYGAEQGQPDGLCNGGVAAQCDGVARTLINKQKPIGSWFGNNYYVYQNYYETAWAIIMLNRTVFESGQPVAVAQAIPNPGVAGQTIQLNGTGSFHQDASRSIDSWAWDLDNDGDCDDAVGPIATTSFPAVGDYPVKLCVTDNGSPELAASTTITVKITTPPLAPTANAGGPYNFCTNAKPWFLNGLGSVNPDEGQSEPGQPGDTIQAYEWDLDGNGQFNDATGAQPDVTAFFEAAGVGDYLIQLKVTDTTATSFPSSNFGDLSDTDPAQVSVKPATDPACRCSVLLGRTKVNTAQIAWTAKDGAEGYNVYRGTIAGGPYLKVATAPKAGKLYVDKSVTSGNTYYYVVRPFGLALNELCQSNEVTAVVPKR
jgi:hypothetical protein